MYINKISKHFELVGISEHLDEMLSLYHSEQFVSIDKDMTQI